ncbi:MAG: hypothetical protein K2Y21_03235 [Phycisphaerales bacterium]|nr:hypothetical protein [Phycisphaerales bacterium]
MIDRVFYFSLAVLPPLVLIGAALALRQAVLASQTRRRVLAGLAAAWMAVAAVVMWVVRGRISGWGGFDNRTFDLAFVGGLSGLALLAASLGAAAVFGRSSRGVPLCPRCWYDMSAHEGLCPECGATIRDERELVRRKRSWRLVSAAVAMQLLAQFLYQYHRADHGGGQGLVPTTVLIAGAFALPREIIVSSPGFRDFSLTGRMADDKLSEWQKSWLLNRARAALDEGASGESVRRATELIVRGRFEGELSLGTWKRAMSRLLDGSGLSTEAPVFLARSYLESRKAAGGNRYLQTPVDREAAATELAELVPAFRRVLQESTIGSDEWDTAARLLWAAGKGDVVVASIVESLSFERNQLTLFSGVQTLAAMGRQDPRAAEALVDLINGIENDERFFAAVWTCRVGPESAWLQQAFAVLAESGEANLEVLGAAGLAGSPSTRCEGTELLIRKMARWRPSAPVFLMTLQWPILVSPDDRHASQLLNEVKRYATESTPEIRSEAVGLLAQLAQGAPSRRAEILEFLRLLSTENDRVLAQRAAGAAEELTVRSEAPVFFKIGE